MSPPLRQRPSRTRLQQRRRHSATVVVELVPPDRMAISELIKPFNIPCVLIRHFGARLPKPATIDLIEVRRLVYSCRNQERAY